MKKIIALCLCLVMIAALAACAPAVTTPAGTTKATTAGTTSETTLDAPKPVKLMILSWPEVPHGDPNLVIWQRLNQYANVVIEPMAVHYEGYDAKVQLLFASGDLPDIMLDHGWDVSDHKLINEVVGPSGLLAPIGDYLDKIPSYKKLLEKYKHQLPLITATDGKIYIAATVNDMKSASSGLMMREDKLEAAGFDPSSIKTTEDLYTALTVLRDQNGGKPVVNCRSGLGNLNNLMMVFGGGRGMRWNPDTKEWYQAAITENTKASVVFLNNMIKDNILAKDWASNTDVLWETAFRGGTLFAAFDNMMQIDAANKVLPQAVGADAKMIGIEPPTYNGIKYPWNYGGGISNGYGYIVSAKTEALDNILMMLEFLYNDDNQEFIMYGDEGITFTRNADGSPQVMPGQNWEYEGKIAKEYGSGYAGGILMVPRESRLFEAGYYDLSTSEYYKIWQTYSQTTYLYQNPVFQLNSEELDKVNSLKPAIETYVSESLTQFISGVRSLDEWDKYVEEVNKMGQPEYSQIQNTATKRFNP